MFGYIISSSTKGRILSANGCLGMMIPNFKYIESNNYNNYNYGAKMKIFPYELNVLIVKKRDFTSSKRILDGLKSNNIISNNDIKHKKQILTLYRNMLKCGKNFPNYNIREYINRRVKDEFRQNKYLDKEALDNVLNEAKVNLETMKRQSIIYSLYHKEEDKFILEVESNEDHGNATRTVKQQE